ncbi:MAG TPA: xylulokinase [Spirochaetales bacterium]|nr:xylulokinase [Spirochaetales bacterium]
METVCGVDLGTQSCKVIVYDPIRKKIVSKVQAPLSIIARNDGTREQLGSWYEKALLECFRAIRLELRQTIVAIGVSGQQHGFVPLDENGEVIRPVKLWNDTSTAAECIELTRMAGGQESLLRETGILMLPGYTAPKIYWLKKNEPESYARLRHVLLPHDFINFLLTDNYATEYGDASGTALFDVRKRTWSKPICDLIDPNLLSLLPKLIASDKPVGIVGRKAAERFGIPQGAVVAAGGGDNMMSAIGTGCVRDGFLTMSLGTSGTLYGYSASPVVDPQGNLAAFCSSTGGWLPLLCTMNCTVASEQVRGLFEMSVEQMNEAAAASSIGAEGIVVLPFFNGERIPNLPEGRASIMGATVANFSRANITRAAMEAAIFGMRVGLETFDQLHFPAREIRLVGGGSKSELWRNIAANVTALPIRIPKEEEAAALGAALQAFWCFENSRKNRRISIEEIVDEHVSLEEGMSIEPDVAQVREYKVAYAVYMKYLSALSPLYKTNQI